MKIVQFLRWLDELFTILIKLVFRPLLKSLYLYPLARSVWGKLRVVWFKHLWRRIIPSYTFLQDGQKLYLGNTLIGVSAEMLLGKGVYEKGTTILVKKILSRGDIVVDVGAHVGYFTLTMAQSVGETGKVYAFEPELRNYNLLLKNIRENGLSQVRAFKEAVSNRCQITMMGLAEDSGGHTLIMPDDCHGDFLVETTTLDKFFNGDSKAVKLVKIDVEGSEYAVMEGMKTLIKKQPNLIIIVEMIPSRLEEAKISLGDFFGLIGSYGFISYLIDEESSKLISVNKDNVMNFWDIKKRRNLYLKKEEVCRRY